MEIQEFEISAMIEGQIRFSSFLILCFWVRGGFGLVLNIGVFRWVSTSISVGRSPTLAASSLSWIGGMIFFGLLGLISWSVLMNSSVSSN